MPRRMPRRERRVGANYIENDRERDITFFKRRAGLFKSAADFSALTGAKVAIVLETDIGKMHSFGTPSADPIVDAFLSGGPPIEPFVDDATNARIAWLQSEVARLDNEHSAEEKKAKQWIQHIKKIKDENPEMAANLVFSKDEDLNLEDLIKLFNELTRLQQDIRRRLPPLHGSHETNIGSPSMPQNLLPPSSSSWPDRSVNLPPPLQSSWSHPFSQQPLHPVPLASTQQHTLAPPFPMQVPQMVQSTSILAPAPPQPASLLQLLPHQAHDQLSPPLHFHAHNFSSPYHTMDQPPQNYAIPNSTFEHNVESSPLLVYDLGGNDFVVDDPFAYDHWAHALSDQPYYDAFLGHNANSSYAGTDVGFQADIGNDGRGLPESSSGGQDGDAGVGKEDMVRF